MLPHGPEGAAHLECNTHGDVVKEVARLKQQSGQDLLQYGAGELTHTLLQHDLIDELCFLIYPIMVVGDIFGSAGR
jgi:dihydrofolate reductase